MTTVQSRVNRPVIDATELVGNYEWEFSFAGLAASDSGAPSIFDAFRQQLGLNLKPETGAVEVLVIESVAMPTPN